LKVQQLYAGFQHDFHGLRQRQIGSRRLQSVVPGRNHRESIRSIVGGGSGFYESRRPGQRDLCAGNDGAAFIGDLPRNEAVCATSGRAAKNAAKTK